MFQHVFNVIYMKNKLIFITLQLHSAQYNKCKAHASLILTQLQGA